jgi:hypothetical protein
MRGQTKIRLGIVLGALTLLFACGATTGASAAPPNLFWQTPGDGQEGAGAARFAGPAGVAADPASGHLFVADQINARIVELDPWGEFLKAWGWGVVASGPGDKAPRNERQELSVSATGGNFILTYLNALEDGGSGRQDTAPIPFNAPASAVQGALEGTESLAPGDVAVSGPSGGPYTIEFTGKYADSDIPPLGVKTAALTGTAAVKTLQGGGSFEICVPAEGDVCQEGQSGGNAPGQLASPRGGVALDGAGDVYVFEVIREDRGEGPSYRVQKFDPAGHFLLMWGGEVNKTKTAEPSSSEAERNLCTKAQVEGGDVCGTGVTGTGKGQFAQGFGGNKIAIGPGGEIFVGDTGRIQEFNPAGGFEGEVKVPGEEVLSLAVSGDGNFYATFDDPGIGPTPKDGVRKLSPTGALLATLPVSAPTSLAVGGDGDLYVVSDYSEPGPSGSERYNDTIVKFDSAGNTIISQGEHFAETTTITGGLNGLATSSACGIAGEDVYVSLSDNSGGNLIRAVRAYGPPPDTDLCPPPARAPTIEDQYAISVELRSATLRAKINPLFWPDTRYFVQYGTGKCSEGGCTQEQPAPPGFLLTENTTNVTLNTAGIFLGGLQPDTTYHYRFVAESGGGGPVRGIGGAEGIDGEEGTFTTFPAAAAPNTGCPNQAFRVGVSANLPDCRAYEMVSPVEKNNTDILTLRGYINERVSFNQSSTDGEKLAYSVYTAFGDAQSAPYTSAYIANRAEGGWSSHGISPPRGQYLYTENPSLVGLSQFKAFSPDLCAAWIVEDSTSALAPGAVSGFPNLYRRQSCGEEADTYTTLSTAEPPNRKPSDFVPRVQGVSADGARMIFLAQDALTANAPALPASEQLLYESFGVGKVRFVCILPDNTPVSTGCSAGTGTDNDVTARYSAVSHAISVDGSRIFWSDDDLAQGKLYVRIGGKETVPITSQPAQFWTATADGSKAIYTIGALGTNKGVGKANLYEFDVDAKETQLIAGKVDGLLGASDDASRIYLVSHEALDVAAAAGEPNLYLYEGGAFTFIATLTSVDAAAILNGPRSSVAIAPVNHTAEVSADGLHVAFMSTGSLTGEDNTDLASGEAAAEVYAYDAAAGELRCASCNPTGARPAAVNQSETADAPFWVAAQIPTSETMLYRLPRVLSSDGQRLFFEAFTPLVPSDTNGRADVYQWEAPGKGDCTEESSSFSEVNGGCVSLISSGESPIDSQIYAVDADGSDVFISTVSSLLPQDSGLIDVYDARIGGGYPIPVGTAACEGEACQGPLVPPNDPTPASSAYEGPGNPKPVAKKKQKRAKKHRKAKRDRHGAKRRRGSHDNRRAGR